MARLLVCYAHPGHKHSHVNKYMASAAAALDGITFVDLYSDYPRFDIDVDAEQQRLLDHDVISVWRLTPFKGLANCSSSMSSWTRLKLWPISTAAAPGRAFAWSPAMDW